MILITGRGRTSARVSCSAIRKALLESDGSLNSFIFRRLHCVTHNGAYLLSSTTELDIDFLRHELQLSMPHPHLAAVFDRCKTHFAQSFGDAVRVSREPISIRVIPSRNSDSTALRRQATRFYDTLPSSWRNTLHPICGLYGAGETWEFTGTHKGHALRRTAEILGLDQKAILRIGDQGAARYNDFELLDSPCGFSVGKLSRRADRCFPVLNQVGGGRLFGARGTASVLEHIKLSPAITLRSPDQRLYHPRLLRFEQLARRRAREETDSFLTSLTCRERLGGVLRYYYRKAA